jgi:hypothetical protein
LDYCSTSYGVRYGERWSKDDQKLIFLFRKFVGAQVVQQQIHLEIEFEVHFGPLAGACSGFESRNPCNKNEIYAKPTNGAPETERMK